MNTRKLSYIGITVCVVVLISVVLVLLFNRSGSRSTATEAVTTNIKPTSQENTLDLSNETQLVPLPSLNVPTVDSILIQACPDPFGQPETDEFGLERLKPNLSESCLATLDSYFMNMRFVPKGGYDWIELPGHITNGRIFANPRVDQELVFEALQRVECQFEEGGRFRPDLKDSCHAESFAVYTSFFQICYLGERGLKLQDLVVDWSDYYESDRETAVEKWDEVLATVSTNDDGDINTRQFTRLKEEVWETALLDEWYKKKCAEFEVDSFLLEPSGRNLSQYEQLRIVSDNFRMIVPWNAHEFTARRINVFMFDVLHAMAARFGDETASLLYPNSREILSSVDGSLVDFNREQYPWSEYLYEAGNLGKFGRHPIDFPGSQIEFTQFIERTIDGLAKLEEIGAKYDLGMLVDQVCRRVPPHVKAKTDRVVNCRTAIEELRAYFDLDVQSISMLDKFEREVRELEVAEP